MMRSHVTVEELPWWAMPQTTHYGKLQAKHLQTQLLNQDNILKYRASVYKLVFNNNLILQRFVK
jgi:hypothetical protein